ncbi:MAG: hypothetical protein QOJ88_1198 [Pyrinomonadaceae bacterium]|jgi:hypothetical protein|nr:hypothetical protein [Pyrinomonadaceae bacterium]
MTDHYQTEQEIEAAVRGFEQCTTRPDNFKHSEHLTVAVYYLRNSTPEQALAKMRSGLVRFLDQHGVGQDKYNETTTGFWIKFLHNLISEFPSDTSLIDLVNEVLPRCADARVVFEYYGPSRLSSAAAKRTWVEPDLKPLAPK